MYQAIIVDDEKWVVKSLTATLDAMQVMEQFHIVAELYDGLSAIRYIKEQQPDLAFVDVRLPGMSGLEILQEANRLSLKTLFIVISGHAEFAYAQKAMLHNAIGYCLKPFSRSELSDSVQKALTILEKRNEPAPVTETAPSVQVLSRGNFVSAMIDYINSHYMEDISIQTLADLCSINPNYAGQLFKQKMNQTFSSYLSNFRIQKAEKLLVDTDMPIALVAASVGYQDYFYFAKVFKKLTGSTPSSYRHEDEPSFVDPTLACSDAAMIVRRDWMENLGLDDPTNIDEFIDLVAAFANDDPDQNGLDDTIGYNVNATNALGKWVMLGIAPDCNTYSWIDQDGTYIPSWYSEQFRDVVSAYRKMYETGGLDPNFYLKNPNEVITDFASGKLGALEYKSSPSSIQLLAEQWELYNDKPFEECVDVLPMFPAPDGTIYCNSSNPFWSESFISSSVDEKKMERILALFDFLLSEEGLHMSKYGLETVDYKIDSSGNYTCLLDTNKTSLLTLLENKYPSIVLFSGLATWGGSDDDFELNEMNFARYGKHCVTLANKDVTWNKEHATLISRPYDFLISPKESSELFSTTNAFSCFIKAIIGSEPALSIWDEEIDELKKQGLDDYIKRQNDSYHTLQEKSNTNSTAKSN